MLLNPVQMFVGIIKKVGTLQKIKKISINKENLAFPEIRAGKPYAKVTSITYLVKFVKISQKYIYKDVPDLTCISI